MISTFIDNFAKRFLIHGSTFCTFLLSSSGLFAANGLYFDIYCEAPDGKTLPTICKPAAEGEWEIYGETWNWQHKTPVYASVSEVSREMETYIDGKYNYCQPTAVSPYGTLNPGIDNDGLLSYSYAMSITIGSMQGGICESITGTNANSYTHQKRFYCESGSQGPYKASNGYRFCVHPQRFKVDISGPSETKALPSLNGPIAQMLTVNGENGPAKKWSIQLKLVDEYGLISYGGGLTNEQGVYEFIYTPPLFRTATIDLSATCTNCETVHKLIYVLPTDLQVDNTQLMCSR